MSIDPTKIFEGIEGQKIALSLLKKSIETKHINSAYLFSGPEGVGKKLTALRFLEAIINNGKNESTHRKKLSENNHPDLLWIEPTYIHQGVLLSKSKATEDGIKIKARPQIRSEQIREVSRFLSRKPIESSKGMVLIENAESMAESASNSLLKTLEEPGDGIFILISSRPDKLLKTILSRCQEIKFNPLNKEDFKRVLHKLNIPYSDYINITKEEVELINLSNGSPGSFFDNYQIMKEVSLSIRKSLEDLPKDYLVVLSLARDITETLTIEQQFWIIKWLQQKYWNKRKDSAPIKRLENLRIHLNKFVQPKLAWEVALLELISMN